MSDKKVAIKLSTLENIGNAVRNKEGSTDLIPVNTLADRIAALPSGEDNIDKHFLLINTNEFILDGDTCLGFNPSANKYITNGLLDGYIFPSSYSLKNGEAVYGNTYQVSKIANPSRKSDGGFNPTQFTGVTTIYIPSNITEIKAGTFNESTAENIIIEGTLNIIGEGQRVFRNCNNLKTLDTTKINVSSATTDIGTMFQNCSKLSSINVSHWNTSNVENMSYLFNGLSILTTLDVSSFDTSKVTNMKAMFQLCRGLTTLDVSSFDTSKVTNMGAMLYGCSRLRNILGTIDMINVKDASSMFYSCASLTSVILKNIRVSVSFDVVPLTLSAILNTANELWEVDNTRTLTLSSTVKNTLASTYVKLIPITAAMREQDAYIDNKKPCVECESTDEGAMTLTEYIISKNWAIA